MELFIGWILFIIFMGLTYLVLIPISIYYTCKFHGYRESMFIAKRNPKIVLIFIFCLLIWIALDRPLHFLYYTCLHLQYTQCTFFSNIPLKITYPLSVLGISLSLVTRIWIIYYDIKFNQSLQLKEWTVLFNPNSNTNNWFIQNNKKCGNIRWFCKYIMLPIFLLLYIIVVTGWSYTAYFNLSYRLYAAMTDLLIFALV